MSHHLPTEYLTQMLHGYGGIFIRFKKNLSWHIFCIMWVSILKKKKNTGRILGIISLRNTRTAIGKIQCYFYEPNISKPDPNIYVKKALYEKKVYSIRASFWAPTWLPFVNTTAGTSLCEKHLWPDSHSRSAATGYNSHLWCVTTWNTSANPKSQN